MEARHRAEVRVAMERVQARITAERSADVEYQAVLWRVLMN